MTKLLMFAGSARKASTNKKLAALAASIAQDAGADVTLIDLKDFEMPIYNGDIEAETGLPENAKRLKQLFVDHDGLFIASPEYNSSISPLLKNALDWISRKHIEDEPPLWAYNGKVAALGAVAPGALGGLRGLVPLRMMLGNIGVTVVPNQVAVSNGASAFDASETLNNEQQAQFLKATVDQLIMTTRAISEA
ncbi:NAD(P)H-dependent oxidoreductase [Aliiroseovarius sp. F47248L]|uniref:NADPH-dependent FMN reductase n=1 Tax=Aliiroseovarius sp. F47248L TaxID=2926420 RepID=UPI001FF6A7FF|nr:NAD(P)H-dependent oxidoreductase [Aliiroseovarius sp. F47248L]MCK0137856.1 NAD(P)H-dependent oxidoreductase [Aliiroseovarius sp. F47248L]